MPMTKEFDVHGWNYAQGQAQLDGLFAQFGNHIREQWNLYGGKAISLLLCEMIARHGEHLSVPSWIGVTEDDILTVDELQKKLHQSSIVMIRSSESDEDWLDGRAGVHKSKMDSVYEVPKILEPCPQKFVIQAAVEGMGFVVDVGFSELLQRPILRVAHGNVSKIHGSYCFTSPTWDHEASAGIYDAHSIETIVRLSQATYHNIAIALGRELVQSLQRLNITFGVQCELLIDPEEPTKWNLVQVRPSPGILQGLSSLPPIEGELIATTGKVSRAGSVTGPIYSVRDYDSRLAGTEDLSGKIVLWGEGTLGPYNSLEELHQANKQGAVGHIGPRHLIVNSAHGTYLPLFPVQVEHFESVQAGPLMMGVTGNYWELRRKVNGFKKLQLVSDGLVGQIYGL